jgi:hypothetical protein
VSAGARWICQQKKQHSTEVGKRKTTETMWLRRPGGNMLSMVAAVRIAASLTMWIEQRGTSDSGKEEEVGKFEGKWRTPPLVKWFSYN